MFSVCQKRCTTGFSGQTCLHTGIQKISESVELFKWNRPCFISQNFACLSFCAALDMVHRAIVYSPTGAVFSHALCRKWCRPSSTEVSRSMFWLRSFTRCASGEQIVHAVFLHVLYCLWQLLKKLRGHFCNSCGEWSLLHPRPCPCSVADVCLKLLVIFTWHQQDPLNLFIRTRLSKELF